MHSPAEELRGSLKYLVELVLASLLDSTAKGKTEEHILALQT